jgi:hypothetical protein
VFLRSWGAAFWVFMAVVLIYPCVPAFTPSALHVGYLWGLSLFVVLSAFRQHRVRWVLWGLAAEFAYLAIVGTSILPPRSLLRLPAC